MPLGTYLNEPKSQSTRNLNQHVWNNFIQTANTQ
ncbi:rCG52983 [Rattus norvegicus]|uniref:RCG52983 n=1 Tax=Rattus norvegicus TaxID=10116 RepID=A6IRV2_RAT|nr:rCG52983 [Rattus norvegicus]